jgi:glycosyltransferase involved in cell wall biosynthesis
MRIAWFTPLSAASAIGEFSCHVTKTLSDVAEVEIWTSDEPPYHDTHFPVIRYLDDTDNLATLSMSDAVVYNMGDYLPFHGHMHAVAQRVPGVVILHDRVLHHLYAGLWLNAPEPARETYVERMRAYYGDAGAEIARASLEGERCPVWESDEEVLRYPLYEEGIRKAHGVVTHSESQAADVRARWLGPVRALRLPCYSDILSRVNGMRPRDPDGPVQLLSVGHLNPNKQVHRVVEMLAADPELAARVHYTVVGPDDGFKTYVNDLRRLIARHADQVSVELLGWRPEVELDRLMAQADVFVNLRHPVMEGSSASLMRQLAYGRPILCFESGFFAELPEGTVERVPTGDFQAADEALRQLIGNPDRRRALGERARALATSYSEHSYAEGLLQLIEESRRAGPALGCLDSVARELGQMNVDSRLPIFDEIAKDFARILDV